MSTGITGGDMNSRLPLFDKKQFPEGIAGERPNFRDPKALHSTPGPQKKRPESSLAEQLIKSQLIKSQMLPSDKLDGVFLLSMSNSIQPNPYQGTTLGEYFRTRFNFDPSELKGSNPMGSVNQWSTNLSKTLNIILTVKKAETEEYKNLMKNVLVVREQKLYLKTTDGQEFGNSLGSVPNGLESIWDKNDPDYNTLQEVRNNVYKQVLDVVRHSMRTAVHGVVKEVESLRGDFGEMMADQSGLNQAKKRLEVDIKEHLAKGENLDTLEKQLGEISDLQAQVSAKYAQSEEQLKYLASLIKSAEIFKTEVANFDRILVTLEAEVESFNTEAQVYTTKLTELTQEIDRLSANLSKQKDEFVENNRKFDLNILLMDLPPKENPSPPQTTPAQPHKCSVFDGNPGEMASKPIAQAANDALANARITRNSGWEDKWNTHYTRKTPEEIGRIVLLALSKAIGDFDERYTSLSETFEALDSKIKSVSKMEQEYRNLEIKRSVLEGQRAAVDSERANLTDKEENFKVELKTLVTNLTDLRTLMGNLNQALLKPNGGENGETMQHTLERRNQEINALNEKINSFKKQSDEFQKNHKDLDQLPSIADLVNQMVDRTNVVIQAYAGIDGVRSGVSRKNSDLVPEVNQFDGHQGIPETPDALQLFNIQTYGSINFPISSEVVLRHVPSISPLERPTGKAAPKPKIVPLFEFVAEEFNAKVGLNLLESATFTMNGVFTKKLHHMDNSLKSPKKREAAIRKTLSRSVRPADDDKMNSLLSRMNELKNSGIVFSEQGDVLTGDNLFEEYKKRIGIQIKTVGDSVTITVVSAGMDKFLEAVGKKIDKLEKEIKDLDTDKQVLNTASQLISEAVTLMYSGEACPKGTAEYLSPILAGFSDQAPWLANKLKKWVKPPA